MANAQTSAYDKVDYVMYQHELFSIKVPDYLVQVNDLDARALVQMRNEFNETYWMLLPHLKINNQTLQSLEEHFLSTLTSKGGSVLSRNELKIGGLKAVQLEVEWRVDGVKLAYLITFVDTPEMIYKIYGWTLASQKNYLQHFKESVASFSIHNVQASR